MTYRKTLPASPTTILYYTNAQPCSQLDSVCICSSPLMLGGIKVNSNGGSINLHDTLYGSVLYLDNLYTYHIYVHVLLFYASP